MKKKLTAQLSNDLVDAWAQKEHITCTLCSGGLELHTCFVPSSIDLKEGFIQGEDDTSLQLQMDAIKDIALTVDEFKEYEITTENGSTCVFDFIEREVS